MKEFRKKPVTIQAMQFNTLEDYLRIVQWMKDSGSTTADEVRYSTPIMTIPTLEGTHAANPGDWIIRGVKGEFYPCKPDIFLMTYEPAIGASQPIDEAAIRAARDAKWREQVLALTVDANVAKKLGGSGIGNGIACEEICQHEDCLGDDCPIRKLAEEGVG